MCAAEHIWAKDHLLETQVNCFTKHLEIAKTKVGLEFFSAKKQFLNSPLPPPPISKMKVEDFESSFDLSKNILIFSRL